MKLKAVSGIMLTLLLVSILTVVFKTSHVRAQEPYVKVYVDQPLGYIEAKPAGMKFWVDILVNASGLPFYHPDGMVGWRLRVQVDPTVLKLVKVLGATDGYFLYDFTAITGLNYTTEVVIRKNIYPSTGVVDVSEQIVPTPPFGAGTDDPYGLMPAPQLLVSIQFESLTLYRDSIIDIVAPEYMDAYGTWHAAVDGDGLYKGIPPPPPLAYLVGKKGWKEHNRFVRSKDGDPTVPDSHGTPGIMTLYAKIKNIGDLPVTVRALFRMSKGGAVEPMVVSNEVLLEPGDWVIVQGDARAFTAADDGKWSLDVFCEYYFYGAWYPGETTKTTRFVVLP
jgi:hypothetical protein